MLSFNFNVPCIISYFPIADSSVASQISIPSKFGVSPITCPLYVYSNIGFGVPYILLAFFASIYIVLFIIFKVAIFDFLL